MSSIRKFLNDESGATAIEYGLIAALISVALITTLKLVTTNLDGVYTRIATELEEALKK